MKPLAFLPNQAGFKFLGITQSGKEVECVVVLENGLHRVSGANFKDLKGWK